jgi:hypothetical protein
MINKRISLDKYISSHIGEDIRINYPHSHYYFNAQIIHSTRDIDEFNVKYETGCIQGTDIYTGNMKINKKTGSITGIITNNNDNKSIEIIIILLDVFSSIQILGG